MSATDALARAALQDAWPALSPRERWEGFGLLPRADAEERFAALEPHDQLEMLEATALRARRAWVRLLPPDCCIRTIAASDPR